MLFYFCVFGVPDTFHYIKGPASITAFNGQTSNRASYAARVTPITIGTSHIGQGGLVQEIQNRINITDEENPKLLFVISLYIFQHWNEERVGWLKIDTSKGNREEFSQGINVMKQRLVARGLLLATLPDPIVQVNFDVVPAGAGRRGVVCQEVEFALHPQYPNLNLAELINAASLLDRNALWEIELLPDPQQPLA